jgi:hydrogenase nickel incorporation protein HypA/HybF
MSRIGRVPVHELALCGAIADIVTRQAGERRVAAVHVRIGELRQVVPDTLAFCWTMVTEATELAGAELEVERVPAAVHCRACDRHLPMAGAMAIVCPACGSFDVEVTAGEEFDVTALDLAVV